MRTDPPPRLLNVRHPDRELNDAPPFDTFTHELRPSRIRFR